VLDVLGDLFNVFTGTDTISQDEGSRQELGKEFGIMTGWTWGLRLSLETEDWKLTGRSLGAEKERITSCVITGKRNAPSAVCVQNFDDS